MLSKSLAKTALTRSIKRQVDVLGTDTWYWEYPADSTEAKTIVMIHGYRGNHHGLEAIAGALADYRILIPDLPGFGASSELSADHSVENYAAWLKEFLAVTKASSELNLIGHSFGSLIVGKYASSYSPKSVILINPVSTPPTRGERVALTKLANLFYSIADKLPRVLGERLLRMRLSVLIMSIAMAKTKNRNLRKWIHSQHLDNFSDFSSIRVAVEGYQASISNALENFAPSITSPVLIIATELDDITSISDQRRVAALYPNAKIFEIASVGHLTHYEAPEIAAVAIREFLTSQK